MLVLLTAGAGMLVLVPKLRIPYPILLVIGGLALGFVPGLPDVTMAPELVLQSGPIDGRADLYALGCVAFWLLTGRNVFEGKSAIELIVSHVHSQAPSPSQFSGAPIPEAFERIVLMCLEKSPDARPADANELFEQLDACSLEPALAWTPQRAEAWWREKAEA